MEALELGIGDLFAEEKDEEQEEESEDEYHDALQDQQPTKQHGRWCRMKNSIRRTLRRLRSCV